MDSAPFEIALAACIGLATFIAFAALLFSLRCLSNLLMRKEREHGRLP